MARMSRIVAVDYPHHITPRRVRSMDIFQSNRDRNQYLQFVTEEAEKCRMDILVWCLMTNHVHFIVVPHGEDSLAKGFGEAHKRIYAHEEFQ